MLFCLECGKVKIGATLCSASSWMSDSSVQCSGVSPGVGTRDVAIHLAGNSNALSSAFTYNSPVITSISQVWFLICLHNFQRNRT